MSTPDQTTYCAAQVPRREPLAAGAVDLGYYCGRPAAGPHPDPARGYRFPLCAEHRRQALEELAVWDGEHWTIEEVLT